LHLQILVLVTVVLPLLLVLQQGSSAEAICDALGFEFLEKVESRTRFPPSTLAIIPFVIRLSFYISIFLSFPQKNPVRCSST